VVEKSKGESLDEEREAERRFAETLGRLVNTPHKPHAPIGAKPKPTTRTKP
jgi:hypothetical protein